MSTSPTNYNAFLVWNHTEMFRFETRWVVYIPNNFYDLQLLEVQHAIVRELFPDDHQLPAEFRGAWFEEDPVHIPLDPSHTRETYADAIAEYIIHRFEEADALHATHCHSPSDCAARCYCVQPIDMSQFRDDEVAFEPKHSWASTGVDGSVDYGEPLGRKGLPPIEPLTSITLKKILALRQEQKLKGDHDDPNFVQQVTKY